MASVDEGFLVVAEFEVTQRTVAQRRVFVDGGTNVLAHTCSVVEAGCTHGQQVVGNGAVRIAVLQVVRAPLASPFKILAKAKFKVALPPMLEMARP